MKPIKFNKHDFLYIAICITLLITSVIYLQNNFWKASPEHSIDFKINKDESRSIGEEFCKNLKIDLSEYHHGVAFDYDNQAKVFLEKEIGIEESHDYLNKEFHIFHWSNRWFIPLSREEIKVNITPEGKISLFEHIIPEEKKLPCLTINEARSLARLFLQNNFEINISNWEFIEEKTDVKPNRVDFHFTYKQKNIEIYNATYRFKIVIQGNEIGKYTEYLHVPEQWKRDYNKLRSLNTTTSVTANIFYILILISVLIVFLIHIMKKNLSLKIPLIFGGMTFILLFVSTLNEIPIRQYYFDTNQSMSSFYMEIILKGVLSALMTGFLVTILTFAGESIFRKQNPGKISLSGIFSAKGIRTKNFFFSIIIGATLAVFFIAFQTFFYITARKFGAWSPADINYSHILNTAFPWIVIILAGFAPAVLEEFTFRLFAIPFFRKITGSKVIAIIFPAIVWGFLHANYPNQPFWIRGVEVGFIGILIAMVFLKFNILTVLVWHYTVDAIYSSLVLIKSGSGYHVISGIMAASIMVLPLFYNLYYYWKNKGFESSDSIKIIDDSEKSEEKPLITEPLYKKKIKYSSLSGKRIKVGIGIITLSVIICTLPISKIGDFYKYPYKKSEIINTAKNYLITKGIDPENYKLSVKLNKNYKSDWGKYILEHTDIDELNSILARYLTKSVVWQCRFFIPTEKDEYLLNIHPMDNSVVSFFHLIEDQADRPSIDKKLAKLRVKKFLVKQNIDLEKYQLKEDFSKIRKKRTDHTFVYESNEQCDANIGNARHRIEIIVKGDEIATYTNYYKLPESWLRKEEQKTFFDTIRLVLKIISMFSMGIYFIIYLTSKYNFDTFIWKKPVIIGSIITILLFLSDVLNFNSAQIYYNTSWQFSTWIILFFSGSIIQSMATGAALTLLILGVVNLFPDSLNNLQKENRKILAPDALFGSVVSIFGYCAIFHFFKWWATKFPSAIPVPDFSIPRFIAHPAPIFHGVLDIIFYGIIALSMMGFATFFFNKILQGILKKVGILILLLFIFLPSEISTLHEFIYFYIESAFLIIWTFAIIFYFLRNNTLAYLLTSFGFVSINSIMIYLHSGSLPGRIYSYYLITFLVIIVIWIITELRDNAHN